MIALKFKDGVCMFINEENINHENKTALRKQWFEKTAKPSKFVSIIDGLPDLKETLSLLAICKLADKYGIHIANHYAVLQSFSNHEIDTEQYYEFYKNFIKFLNKSPDWIVYYAQCKELFQQKMQQIGYNRIYQTLLDEIIGYVKSLYKPAPNQLNIF